MNRQKQRIGELLLAIPKASGQYAESENRPASKSTIVSEMGYSKDEASDYQYTSTSDERPTKAQTIADMGYGATAEQISDKKRGIGNARFP